MLALLSVDITSIVIGTLKYDFYSELSVLMENVPRK
jgi:hypothetical protein